MFKIIADRKSSSSRTKFNSQEYKIGIVKHKLYPESLSGYPVSGQFYGSDL